MEVTPFLMPPGSVCRRSVAGFTTVLLDVKSLVEHVGEGYRSRESERFSSYAHSL